MILTGTRMESRYVTINMRGGQINAKKNTPKPMARMVDRRITGGGIKPSSALALALRFKTGSAMLVYTKRSCKLEVLLAQPCTKLEQIRQTFVKSSPRQTSGVSSLTMDGVFQMTYT
jgi:hypothetical protein